jgi:UPF0755 protein
MNRPRRRKPPAQKRSSDPSRAKVRGSVGMPRSSAASVRTRTFWMMAFATVLMIALFFVGFYYITPHKGRGVTVRVYIPPDADANTIALRLYRSGVIDRPWLFSWLLTASGTLREVPRDSTLSVRDDATPRAVLRVLRSARGWIRVTIPEGYNRFEIARRLVQQRLIDHETEFVARTEDPGVLQHFGIRAPSLEGYLYPDTYEWNASVTVDEMLERMVRNFRQRMTLLRARNPRGVARANAHGLDEHALVTLASLIEKETGSAIDRPRVAAVFWNRLTLASFEPRLLQSDPTIGYGCFTAHPPSCRDASPYARLTITRSMLEDSDNPYNTYRHVGLPPGPIANPGSHALQAALSPAETNDLYFVAMGHGRSAFASTLAEHEQNVQRYLRTPARVASDAGRSSH